MMDDALRSSRLFQLLSRLLEYPTESVSSVCEECANRVSVDCQGAAALLYEFGRESLELGLGELQEAYIQAFEMNPERSLYAGYHLFGESYKRSLFLLGLNQRYRERGFDAGRELPDHLAVMLQYLSLDRDPGDPREIIEEAVLPALDKILAAGPAQHEEEGIEEVEQNPSPYLGLLQASRQILERCVSTRPGMGVPAGVGDSCPYCGIGEADLC